MAEVVAVTPKAAEVPPSIAWRFPLHVYKPFLLPLLALQPNVRIEGAMDRADCRGAVVAAASGGQGWHNHPSRPHYPN